MCVIMLGMDQVKTCSKCGLEKPVSHFYKDGLRQRADCKPCIKIYKSNYRATNLEKLRAACRKWAKSNPDKIKAGKEKWRKANPKKLLSANQRWRKANPDTVMAYGKKNVLSMSTYYIKSLLSQDQSFGSKDIPQELIELKRVQLQITRTLKELNKCK